MNKQPKRWSDQEDNLVLKLYPTCVKRENLLDILPDRKWINIVVRARRLGAVRIRSCPVGRGRGMDHPLATGQGKIPGWLVSRMRGGARSRGIECPLLDGSDDSYAYLNRILTDRCMFSGHYLTFPTYSGDSSGTASLDRIDSSIGYIKGNVRWIHKVVNRMRKDGSDEWFIALIRDIARHIQE